MIEKVKEIQGLVERLLEEYPTYRDSDKKLCSHIWMIEVGGINNMRKMNAYDFLYHLSNSEELSSFESISRARRKIQENLPHLRGQTFKERKKREQKFRSEIKK